MNNYIIIGDSITYGIGDIETGGWASMFKKHIVSQDDSKVCNNYVHIVGFPGATSNDILNKINYIFNTYKDNECKNVVILSIGINDTQEFNGTLKNSIEEYKSNIERIIKYLLDENAEIIILGLTKIESDEKFFWKPMKYYDNKTILEFDQELKELCNNKVKYIPMINVLQNGDYIDGLHPNHVGHEKLCKAIESELSHYENN